MPTVQDYRRQMVAGTTRYAAPPIPGRPAYPAGGSALLGALTGATETDQAAHLQRQMSAFSPLARSQQDAAQSAQVAANVRAIAGHRQLRDGPWGDTPPSPYVSAPSQAPARIGIQAGPARRIGVPAPAPQARLASMSTQQAAPAGRAAPHAYGPVVPGVDYAPTPIEPAKNTWRPDQGSPSFNWRTHPGMVPLDDATLKAHPYQASIAARGPRSGYDAPGSARPTSIMGALMAGVQRQAADAAGRSDLDGMARAMGSIDALRNNGAAGLLDFSHRAAMQDSQREQAGAKIGVLDRTNIGQRVGIYTSPEHARDAMTAKTGDPAMGQQAMQTQRLTEAVAGARAGGPFNLDPADAQLYLEQNHPQVASLFRQDEGGAVSGGQLHDIYGNLAATKPQGWDDPASMLSRALAARVPQVYGTELLEQLRMPSSPQDNRLAAGLGDPDLEASGSWLPEFIGGPARAAREWGGGVFNSMNDGGLSNITLMPGSRYATRAPAINWFNRIQSYRPTP